VQKSGAKVWEGEYRAFGALVAEEGSWENRLRFPGQYYDEETNNYYNYHRDYDPTIGRYIQSDPIGLAGGLNTFVYVKNNPIVNLDFWGLHKKDKWWGRTNRNFQWWYHNCYKQPGDPDADKETIEDAYSEWQDRGSPTRGKCDDLPPPPPIVPEPEPDSSAGCDSDCEQIIKRVRDAAGAIIIIIITICTGGAATT
jgi:RHS repeat-associated protein